MARGVAHRIQIVVLAAGTQAALYVGRAHVATLLRAEAAERAVAAGADPGTVEVLEVDEVPLPYLPGGATRIRVKAVGDLQLAPARREAVHA